VHLPPCEVLAKPQTRRYAVRQSHISNSPHPHHATVNNTSTALSQAMQHTKPHDFGDVVFTSRWRSGVKAATFVACAYTLGSCLLMDWDDKYGPDHVFRGVRPAIKSFVNSMYGTGTDAVAADAGTAAAEGLSDSKSGGVGSGGASSSSSTSGGASQR